MAKRDRITAADRDADLKLKDRLRLRSLRDSVRVLRLALSTAKVRQAKERRALLVEIRQALRNIPKRDRAKRAEVLKSLAAKRASFQTWWAKVLKERNERRAAIRAAENEAHAWRKGTAARIREAKAQRAAELAERLDTLDDEQTREVERLTDAVRGAERKLKTERADQKSMRRNAKERAKAAPKVSKLEKAREFTGGVEANLTSALEFATWKAKRRQILAQAKRQGVATPDGVAEIVREWTEADEAGALDALQNDVDRWLSAEIARKEAA